MHRSRVNNFHVSDGTHDPFATIVVTLGEGDDDMQINSSMSTMGGSDVTIFFRSLGDVIQFATSLLSQAIAEDKDCSCEKCTCSKEGK